MPLRLRTSTVRRKGKAYRYHQLTRAVRKNGKPTHEVVAHLGRLCGGEAEAIREALDQLAGRRLPAPDPSDPPRYRLDEIVGRAAPRYLDIAVVDRLWNEWGFAQFFAEHLAAGDDNVAPADVVEVLVANRCLAPMSKLRSTEWCPRTVLPELLGFAPRQFNNTRIHRVLNRLVDIEPALTRFLVAHPLRQTDIESLIFLDGTDTWFVGKGGDLAGDGKCKDGSRQDHRIQIALAVDQRGLPLRWEVFASNESENGQLGKWLDAIDALPGLNTVPLVFDRGFSTNDNLRLLVDRQRPFVTCARQPQLIDWTNDVDFASIASSPSAKRPPAALLCKAGLTQDPTDSDLFYVDQAVRTPHTTRSPLPKMRVVLFFRPTQYAFDTHRIEQQRKRLFAKLDEINEDLANAQKDRKEATTIARMQRELKKRQMQYDYTIELRPITVRNSNDTTVSSFQVELLARDYAEQKRDYNAGWRILLANEQDTRPAAELVRVYDQKHLVEDAFRTIKSFVDLRPIRHQKTPKIKAHVTICVLAMLLDRWLEIRLRERGVHDAVDRVYEMLEPCRLLVLGPRDGKDSHLQLTESDSLQRRLLTALRMEDLLHRLPFEQFQPRRY